MLRIATPKDPDPVNNRWNRSRAVGRFAVGHWRMWFAALVALLLLPWIYINLFTPAPGQVVLPALQVDTRYRVFVVGWGYHTSIVIEQPPGWRLGPEGAEDAPFVEYGWGDRRFMMESNYWPHALFAALMLPTESVSYVCPMSVPPTENPYAKEVYIRELDGQDFTRLVVALEQEMVRQAGGSRRLPFPPVPRYLGRFYAARDYYVFWNNCNAWTVKMLANAGCSTSADLVFSEGQVCGRLTGFTRVDLKLSSATD